MESYRIYKGHGIISTLKTSIRPRIWYVHGIPFTTRQQARDYINTLLKEKHGNTPAGIQNPITTEK